MEKKLKIREGFFNATGSELLPNGCIKFTHFSPGRWALCEPADVVRAIYDNPTEDGGEWNRMHYTESVNSWLKKINRVDLQISIAYDIATVTIVETQHICQCGNTWHTTESRSDSPNTDAWGNGIATPPEFRDTFIREYVRAIGTPIMEKTCSHCEMTRKIIALCAQIPRLESEVRSRRIAAVNFFIARPECSPANYTVVHRSNGYNPTAKNRNGTRIGHTNARTHGHCIDAAYLVRSDAV